MPRTDMAVPKLASTMTNLEATPDDASVSPLAGALVGGSDLVVVGLDEGASVGMAVVGDGVVGFVMLLAHEAPLASVTMRSTDKAAGLLV